ncbi:MAG: TRAP transporter small permease, partial [Natronospirillum sp.]
FSLPWVEPLNQVAVLWIALLGSMIGARRDNHIKIDLVAQLVPLRFSHWVQKLVALTSSIALGFVCYHTARLVADERAWGTAQVAGVDVWQLQTIMPVAFGIMAARYALMIFSPVVTPTTNPIAKREGMHT